MIEDLLNVRDRYTYRRSWIMLREEQLAGLFTIDIEFRSEMRNHLHVVLRPCPRAAKRLSAVEMARRWLTITKLAKCMTDELPLPDEERVQELANDKTRVKTLRKQLSSISWFMAILLENISGLKSACLLSWWKPKSWSRRFGYRELKIDHSAFGQRRLREASRLWTADSRPWLTKKPLSHIYR